MKSRNGMRKLIGRGNIVGSVESWVSCEGLRIKSGGGWKKMGEVKEDCEREVQQK